MKIWKDPVWSKVISPIIIMVGTAVWSIISAKAENISFSDAWMNFWNLNVKLWWVAVAIIIYVLLIYIKSRKTKKSFLNYIQGEWSGTNWEWNWVYDKEIKKYKISNLNMLCPQCKTGVFTVATIYSHNYKCINCGYSTPTQDLLNKPFTNQVKKEIQKEISRKFPTEAKYIYWDSQPLI